MSLSFKKHRHFERLFSKAILFKYFRLLDDNMVMIVVVHLNVKSKRNINLK